MDSQSVHAGMGGGDGQKQAANGMSPVSDGRRLKMEITVSSDNPWANSARLSARNPARPALYNRKIFQRCRLRAIGGTKQMLLSAKIPNERRVCISFMNAQDSARALLLRLLSD